MPRAKKMWIKYFLPVALWAVIAGCASTPMIPGQIPAPEETAKLRIFVQAVSGPPHARSGKWKTAHQEFEAKTLLAVERILRGKGIYQVIGPTEKRQVLGKHAVTFWQWTKSDFALARQAGKALYAEYALVVERGFVGTSPYWRAVLLNVDTGKRFAVYSSLVQGGDKADFSRMIKASYREIFRDAKADLLTTALRKSRISVTASKAAGMQEEKAAKVFPSREKEQDPAAESGLGRKFELETAVDRDAPVEGKTPVAVHDFEAAENQRVVALILAEALREELFHLGVFTLVSRESLKEAVDEIRLGQSGLVDEKQAVQAGRMLAARQIILGRLSALEKTSVLQIKRLDSESQQVLAFASHKCEAGREEDLLEWMPQIASRLAQR